MSEISADIKARVLRDFGKVDAPKVEQGLLETMAVLQKYKVLEIPRVLRCVVQYAAGDWGRLEYALKIAKIDYRDAIMFGEYEPRDKTLQRVRNLTEPFEF